MLVGMDCSFPTSHCTWFLDARFKSYEVFSFSAKVGACSHTSRKTGLLRLGERLGSES
jgi:hypothetical protein